MAMVNPPGNPDFTMPVPTNAKLNVIAAMLPAKPQGVGRPITDRAAWAQAAKQPFFQEQLTDAATFAPQPIPAITQEELDEVKNTGKRDTYEIPFKARSTRLDAFVVAECINDDGKYLPYIEAELDAILHETTWADSTSIAWNQLPGGPGQAVDLGVAARAWTIATADYFLGDKLKPETRQAIRNQMRHRVFAMYEDSIRSGQPIWWWMAVKANWNPVCTAGVLGAALTLIDSPQERALFIFAAQNELPYYMEGISDDGYCYEGVGYWAYGFGNYLRASEIIYEQTQGKINLFAGAKQRHEALFKVHLEIIPGVWPAYGDAFPKPEPIPPGRKLGTMSGALMELVNQRWNMGWTIPNAGKSDMAVPGALGDNMSGFGMFGFPRPDFGAAPGSPPASDDAITGDKRYFFKEASVLVSRAITPDKAPFGFSVKGGHNGLPHGHNDNGSYVVGYDDWPLILDPGMEFYTAKTFSTHRFESMMMNSYGHDVPYVGKRLQKSGVEAFGKVVSTTFTDQKDTLVMDLTTSYPVPALRSLVRTYIFDRTVPSLEIDEEAHFDQPTDYGSALVTISQEMENGPGSFLVYDKDAAVSATVTVVDSVPSAQIVNKVEKITGFRLYNGVHPIRMGVNLDQPVTHVILKTLIVPATAPKLSQ